MRTQQTCNMQQKANAERQNNETHPRLKIKRKQEKTKITVSLTEYFLIFQHL